MYRTRWLKVLSVRLNLLFSFSLNWPKPNQSICCNVCLLFVCWSSLVNYALYIINPTCSDCSCHLEATVSSLQTTYKINRHLTKNHTKRRQTKSLEILKKNQRKPKEKRRRKKTIGQMNGNGRKRTEMGGNKWTRAKTGGNRGNQVETGITGWKWAKAGENRWKWVKPSANRLKLEETNRNGEKQAELGGNCQKRAKLGENGWNRAQTSENGHRFAETGGNGRTREKTNLPIPPITKSLNPPIPCPQIPQSPLSDSSRI